LFSLILTQHLHATKAKRLHRGDYTYIVVVTPAIWQG